MDFPWKKKGIVLTAPLTSEVDTVVKFIDEYLAPRSFDTVVLQIRYRYQFKSHPELWGYDPLSFGDVKKLLDVCKKNGIKLVPKMNLFGHQCRKVDSPPELGEEHLQTNESGRDFMFHNCLFLKNVSIVRFIADFLFRLILNKENTSYCLI